jgi:hypothetical protein
MRDRHKWTTSWTATGHIIGVAMELEQEVEKDLGLQ